MTTVAVGADHAATELLDALEALLKSRDIKVVRFGSQGASDKADYPHVADEVVAALHSGQASLGLLCCGTGVGMSIAANRHPEIRAVVCSETYSARMARAHNNANVLCLGARVLGVEFAKDILQIFLDTTFEGGRHATRVAMLSQTKSK